MTIIAMSTFNWSIVRCFCDATIEYLEIQTICIE